MMKINPVLSTITTGLLLTSGSCFAWSNQVNVFNHLSTPLTLSISPSKGNAHSELTSTCGTSINNITLHANQGCKFSITDSGTFDPGSDGQITVSTPSNGASCRVHYHYRYHATDNYVPKHSLSFSDLSCSGDQGLNTQMINLISDNYSADPRKLAKTLFGSGDFGKAADSISQASCAATNDKNWFSDTSDNCMIITPSATTSHDNHSSILDALNIQSRMGHAKTLNQEQFIGTHNSLVSPAYTHSDDALNLSHSDPNNFLSLTDQLNSGVRQVEFDILYYDDRITICHNHVTQVPEKVLCNDNTAMHDALAELTTWLSAHPQDLVILYFDINQDLGSHVSDFTADINATIAAHVYTPEMAQADYKKLTGKSLAAQTIPFDTLTADTILNQHKNVIMVATADFDDLTQSKDVFLHVADTNTLPLYERGRDDLNTLLQTDYAHKYANTNAVFSDDPHHNNLWRSNGDRTVISFVQNSHGDISYNDAWNIPTVRKALTLPINILSMDMLGYTNDNDTAHRPLDPRLADYLWSWKLGYPLKDGATQAYLQIDPTNILNSRFVNDPQDATLVSAALCINRDQQWLTAPLSQGQSPQAACIKVNAQFAVPTTSWEMDDVLHQIANPSTHTPQVIIVKYVATSTGAASDYAQVWLADHLP